ncbi:hypothetical protein, partial [Burkholderia stagnalis]|uniref:hypothetical protein n=1 Tax=Burkholderia stagnalis TaxID=1503054 RepID=UPI001C89D5AC
MNRRKFVTDVGLPFGAAAINRLGYLLVVFLNFPLTLNSDLSVILWAGHIMRGKSHGYADEEET